MILPTNVIQLFNNRIRTGSNPEDCWSWAGAKDRNGYGNIEISRGSRTHRVRKAYLAHRISAQLHVGDVDSFHVLHSCDNPECCNPRHLRLGTVADNMNDKLLRGRTATSYEGKLSDAEVIEIYKARLTSAQTDIATKFAVSIRTVSLIWNRKAKIDVINNFLGE